MVLISLGLELKQLIKGAKKLDTLNIDKAFTDSLVADLLINSFRMG